MPIIGPLPFTLTNGTLADATQVQDDLQFIVDEVNTNVPGSSGFTDLTIIGSLDLATTSGSGDFNLLRFATAVNDTLGEVTTGASSRFTAANTGTYVFSVWGNIISQAATTGVAGGLNELQIWINDVVVGGIMVVSWPFADSLARYVSITGNYGTALTAGDFVNFRMNLGWTGTAPFISANSTAIRRIA